VTLNEQPGSMGRRAATSLKKQREIITILSRRSSALEGRKKGTITREWERGERHYSQDLRLKPN